MGAQGNGFPTSAGGTSEGSRFAEPHVRSSQDRWPNFAAIAISRPQTDGEQAVNPCSDANGAKPLSQRVALARRTTLVKDVSRAWAARRNNQWQPPSPAS